MVDGLAVHGTYDGAPSLDVELPATWQATAERPVEALICVEVESDSSNGDCSVTATITAQHRNGTELGTWRYNQSTCPSAGSAVTPPDDWWIDVVGPSLGYVDPALSEGE